MKFQWAGFLLAIISVGTAPIPYKFFMYGEKVRRSKKASKAVKGWGGEGEV